MDKPSTSKAAKDTEVLDLSKPSVSNSTAKDTGVLELSKSSVSNSTAKDTEVLDLSKSSVSSSTAARKRTRKPIHVPKQGSHRTVSTADVVKQDPASVDISKVAADSTNHCFVEPPPKRRVDEYLLVQYRPTPIRVIHKVILESDVIPITTAGVKEADHKDVFVPDGEDMCQACVLTRNKSKDFLIGEMDTVRSKISEVIGLTYLRPEDVDKNAVTRPKGNPWILIQYSADKAECSHTIMRYENSLFNEENPYPGSEVLMEIDGTGVVGEVCEEDLEIDAFRVLTNSTFITIDPKYDFGEKGMLSPSGQKIRLCGGAHEPRKINKNCQCAEETAIITKAPPTEHRFLQPGQQVEPKSKPEKLIKSYTQPKASHGSMVLCKSERIYRILQHGCYEEKQKEKSHPKYRIVYPGGEGVKEEKKRVPKKVKEKKKEKEKEQAKKQPREPSRERSREPSRERALIKRELESEPELERVTPPPMTPPRRCAEKAVGTTDAPSNTSQQHQQAQPTALDLLSWNPLKYFDINCNGAPQAKAEEEEHCAVDPPCTLSLFPFPSLRKPEKRPEPMAAITTKPTKQAAPAPMQEVDLLPCHENQVYPQSPQAEPVQPNPTDINEEIIRAQCSRILNLELQVNELRRELGRMKTEIIPPDEMLRCTALTSKLRELSALLADLKSQHTEAMASVLMAQRQAAATHVKPECTVDTQTPQLPPPPPPPAPPPPRPVMKAEKVQANLLADHAHKISQTNASFGWRPFIDEATQSSPPSTVPVTPKHTSSVPVSTHTSSAASACLPCRHDTGEIPLKETPSFCPYCQGSAPRCPYVERHLEKEIMRIVQFHPPCQVLLSVLLQPKNIYHINISLTGTGEPLGCIYATENAINEAVEADVFERFLTFFIVDARISGQQKDKILAHTFEFFKN